MFYTTMDELFVVHSLFIHHLSFQFWYGGMEGREMPPFVA